MNVIATHIVPDMDKALRLSRYLAGVFVQVTTPSAVKKAISKGCVLVDGSVGTTGTWVESGMKIELTNAIYRTSKVFELAVDVVYEDDHLAVVNKPPGIEVSGNQFRTLRNALPFSLKMSLLEDALAWPEPLHRLDFGTGGLLLVAKTTLALVVLSKDFQERKIQKRYQAVVMGCIDQDMAIKQAVDGKDALTIIKPVRSVPSLNCKALTLIDAFPETGRRHQIRQHMAMIKAPVLGDPDYSPERKRLRSKGLFLSAVQLTFCHPFNGEVVNVEISHPEKFDTFMSREERRYIKLKDKYSSPEK